MKFIATSFLYINSWGWGWHFYSNLVVLVTIETMSNKKGKNLLVTHNQEYKKNNNCKIYAFFNRHKTCLSILATISCNF